MFLPFLPNTYCSHILCSHHIFPFTVRLFVSFLALCVLSTLRHNKASSHPLCTRGADDRDIHPCSLIRAALPHYLQLVTCRHVLSHVQISKWVICLRCCTQRFLFSSFLHLLPKPSVSNREVMLINTPLTQSCTFLTNWQRGQ